MMRDCPNATMRERLPDLLHDRLSAALRAEVRAHLETCAECRAEFQLLEQVRAIVVAPTVDTRRIASALPPYRAAPRWRGTVQSPLFRIAAAVVILLGGAMLVTDAPVPIDEPAVGKPVVSAPVVQTPTGATSQVAVRPSPSATTELAVGEMFHDLTDSDLQALLDELGSLEAVTPVETEVVVPAVNRGGT